MLKKTDVLKTCWKSKYLGIKILKNALTLKSKKVKDIFGETCVLSLLSSGFFSLQNRSSDFCSLLYLEDEADFRDNMNVFANTKIKISKT